MAANTTDIVVVPPDNSTASYQIATEGAGDNVTDTVRNFTSLLLDNLTTTEAPVTESPLPEGGCVRQHFINKTDSYLFYQGYSGIPENLTFNVILFLVSSPSNHNAIELVIEIAIYSYEICIHYVI